MNIQFAPYQILIFLLCILLILRTFIFFINKKKTIREFIVSVCVWGTIASIGLFPNITVELANIIGFELGINFLLVTSVIILFYFVFSQMLKIDKMENSITKLIRQQALQKLKNELEKKS